MAFLWKHPECRFWFARFTDERGRKANRSTRQVDRRQAQTIADGWEHAARLARGNLLTTDKARNVVSEILERLSGGAESIRSEPASDFFRRWLAQKSAHNSEATAARYRGVIHRFETHLGDRAKRPLTAIHPADVQAFLTARSAEVSASTVGSDAKDLSAAFNHAQRQGLLDRNPVLACELPKGESQTRDAFTHEQIRILVRAASPEWKTAILIGYYTGARLSDVINITWDSFDLINGTLNYRQRKTGEVVAAPLHPELKRHLAAMTSGGAERHVIPGHSLQRPGGRNGLSAQFASLMREAGIEVKETRQKSGRKFSALSFHSLRHSFESHLAAANVSPEIRRELAGRVDETVQRMYTHLEQKQLRDALGQLPGVLDD